VASSTHASTPLRSRAVELLKSCRLINELEEKARIYSPLAGVLTKQRDPAAAPLAGLLPDDIQQVLLRYRPRAAEKTEPLPMPPATITTSSAPSLRSSTPRY